MLLKIGLLAGNPTIMAAIDKRSIFKDIIVKIQMKG